MKGKPTPAAYWDQCKAHDWYYNMSDDARVYRKGLDNERELRATSASMGQEYVDIYESFRKQTEKPLPGIPVPDVIPRPVDIAPKKVSKKAREESEEIERLNKIIAILVSGLIQACHMPARYDLLHANLVRKTIGKAKVDRLAELGYTIPEKNLDW